MCRNYQKSKKGEKFYQASPPNFEVEEEWIGVAVRKEPVAFASFWLSSCRKKFFYAAVMCQYSTHVIESCDNKCQNLYQISKAKTLFLISVLLQYECVNES